MKKILLDNSIVLKDIATKLGITPQSLQARFAVKYFKPEYLIELNHIIGKDLFPSDSSDNSDSQKIIDIRVCAGNGIGLDGDENKIIGYVKIPIFKGCTGLTIFGESMYPKYKPGDVIFVKLVTDKTDIDFGRCYVVITRTDRLLKSIYQSSTGHLRLCSYNTSLNPAGEREYPDRDIDTDDIIYLYKVVGKIEREQL